MFNKIKKHLVLIMYQSEEELVMDISMLGLEIHTCHVLDYETIRLQ